MRAVVFDVGETLIDETSQWDAEAQALGLTPLTFFAALGAVIERREHHRETWTLVGRDRATANLPSFTADDLYADALPCLDALHAAGFVLGLAGNQPERAEAVLRGFDVPVDLIASSAGWGIEKPSPRFFERIARELDLPAPAIAYVGDRLDNDVLPAQAAGMLGVFIRRGPWGHIHATWPEASEADHQIESLDEVIRILRP
ncbi:MAG: HAD family hydrolase [Microthrixaceae bacterium]